MKSKIQNLSFYLLITVVLSFSIQSCSSLFYSKKMREKNNTVLIKSNVKDFDFNNQKKGNKTPYYFTGSNSLLIHKLNYRSTFLVFSKDDYKPLKVKIKRIPRLGAVLLDFPLCIFYGLTYGIDVFRGDFYKVSRKNKEINLQFQRTNESFKQKIKESELTLNTMILDALLLDNPDLIIKKEIEEQRVVISKSILYSNIEKMINHNSNGIESYNNLVSKYPQSIPECKMILDSLKKTIESEELTRIKKNSDLLRLIKLTKISDAPFKDSLNLMKPAIEKVVLQDISNKFDFYQIDVLISNEDSVSKEKLFNFRLSLEIKSIEEIKMNNDLSLLNKVYKYLNNKNKLILDGLKPVVTKFNDVELLKKRITDIKYYLSLSDFDKALELVNKYYPNQYSESLPENNILKDLLKNILIEKDINVITTKINKNVDFEINDSQEIYEIESLIDKYKNQTLSTIQKSQIEKLKKQFISKRIECIKKYVNDGGEDINEINLLLNKNEISSTQKSAIKGFKNIAEKNAEIAKKKREQQEKHDAELAQKERNVVQQKRYKFSEDNENFSNQNDSQNENNSRGFSYCYSEMSYDGNGSKYKLTLFDGGVAKMDKNGQILSGRWSGNNGNPGSPSTVRATFNNYSLYLEAGYVNVIGRVSFYIDAQERQWMECY